MNDLLNHRGKMALVTGASYVAGEAVTVDGGATVG